MPTAVQTHLDPIDITSGLRRVVPTGEAREHPRTAEILNRARELGLEVVSDWEPDSDQSLNSRFREQKRSLVLRVNKGSFIKPWESSEHLVGADEWCLTPVEGCPLDCDYCYLQDYLDQPVIKWFVNRDRMIEQIRCFLEDPPEPPPHHFSLGELSDGLFMEPLTHTVRAIWEEFRDTDGTIEIRSKSHHVHGLVEELTPHPNGTVSWTLSPPGIDQKNEMITAPLDQRLEAMNIMMRAGFQVGARLDPVVLRDGWERDYRDLIGRMERNLEIQDLKFIVLGTFRFPRGFDRTIRRRFPNREFHRDEFVESADGKLRYPRARRTDAYRKLTDWLREVGIEPVLCMEPAYVWEDAGLKLPNPSERRSFLWNES